MNYQEIIDNSKKFHYFIKVGNKIVHLSSSNSKSDAKTLALEKLGNQIEKVIGKYLILVKIKEEDPDTNNDLKLIGGPISFLLEYGLVKDKDTIKNLKDSFTHNIYLTKKFIKNNKDNLLKDYKKIISKFLNDKDDLSLIDVYKI